MDNKKEFLTDEEMKALDIDQNAQQTEEQEEEKPVARRGRPKKVVEPEQKTTPVEKQERLVSEKEYELEKARREMFASFNEIPSEELPNLAAKIPTEITEYNLEDLLNGISIDVSNFEVEDKPQIDKIQDAGIRINSKPTFETVCNQSGYTAYMESLKYSDLQSLEQSVESFYANRQRLYSTIYGRINNTSIGRLTYEQFLKSTSLYDVPSLLYGIYCQTFKTEAEFTITCNSCNKEMKVNVPSKALISVKDEEAYNNINEIMGQFSDPDSAVQAAIVNKRTKICLPYSKMIVEVKIPSLYKYLNIIGSVKPDKFDEMQSVLGMMVFIDKLYALDYKALIKDGKAKYYEIKTVKEIADVVSNLELTDASVLQTKLREETEKYAITYRIKGMECRHCHKHIEDIPIDMEEITFFRIEQM